MVEPFLVKRSMGRGPLVVGKGCGWGTSCGREEGGHQSLVVRRGTGGEAFSGREGHGRGASSGWIGISDQATSAREGTVRGPFLVRRGVLGGVPQNSGWSFLKP